jgi:hypothetical protein
MEASVAVVTVSKVEPLTGPLVALIVAVPFVWVLAVPWEPVALEIEATASLDELQVTWVVKSWVEPSEKVPVAVNETVRFAGRLGLVGVTAMEASVAAVTVRLVEPVLPESAAEMVVVPTARVVARPFEPAASETVAVLTSDDDQVTWSVMSCVVLSEYVPVAVNCWVLPLATDGLGGVRAMDSSVAAVTVRPVEPVLPDSAAEMVVVPTARAVARPFEPAASETVAVLTSEDDQVTWSVMSCVVPSAYVPVAVNCWVVPLAMEGSGGVTAMDWSVAAVTVMETVPVTLPTVAVTVTAPGATPVTRPALETVALLVSDDVQDAVLVTSLVELSE